MIFESAKYNINYHFIKNLNKPIILFLHGFIGNINEFDEVIKLLANEFSFLTVDLPGHGKTQVFGGDEYYKMENVAHGVINLLQELKINQCFLVGYSMGGRLALYLTLYFPERFAQVVLESSSPGLATEIERLARVKLDAQIARKLARSVGKLDFAAFLQNWYSQPIFGSIKNHPQFEIMLQSRLGNNPIELTKSLQFMGTGNQPSLWAKLKENTTPLLLLAGEYDEKFIAINTEIAQITKLAQLRVINHAGHNIHLEKTEQFVKSIKDFIPA
ncbi:2-succinyl-6-hydroxy-2,4-cyclohexadiene-1-carboxylate synthase [Umezakia ovalisporum]|uniref:Putative 2-succinyl-6-hydroxy-2,4-cyclohexadiene-1-carboxylate synthase n=1 Tax=Umezakia ovalisporum FSS-62 TaxID=2971776 RepID=A0AA43GZR7_9CYAN|nr:2-succinyl-6-hydroxy-2,4-cyclohexadiene-1-carboxylate synthase [Umezakia ovalisporum]MDH6064776.1 2-succinyl-6-hydroxy-2,4-cyclohexadiene-1-carboxylate synthase [Umezakia ovalisporum FSS-62]MDH6102253.1 2-succinyl-6-hydroxy-2,4-cyclohexadiene-1-carboxylate synthase [Umezakia ovalisporum ANA283AFssAo]